MLFALCAAYEFLKAGVSAQVILEDTDAESDAGGKKGKRRDAAAAPPPAKRRAKGGAAASVPAPVAAASEGELDAGSDETTEQLGVAKLKFAAFCDDLLRRWEGMALSAASAAVAAAGQQAVEEFADANFMTKSHLAKLIVVNVFEAVAAGNTQARKEIPRTLQLMVDYPSIRSVIGCRDWLCHMVTLVGAVSVLWLYTPGRTLRPLRHPSPAGCSWPGFLS